MNEIEVAEMVCDVYYYRLPDGSDPLPGETAVQLVMEHAAVTRKKALGLLLEHSPSRRADRQQCVARVAGLRIAGALDRGAAVQMLMEQTGMPLGWCAAALADAVEDPRGEHGRWTA